MYEGGKVDYDVFRGLSHVTRGGEDVLGHVLGEVQVIRLGGDVLTSG